MLKITAQHGGGKDSVSLFLEGRLAGPWVEELRRCWHELSLNQQRRAVINLTGVTFIDAGGKALLVDLWRQGTILEAAGCLNRCIVEEITKPGKADCSNRSREEHT